MRGVPVPCLVVVLVTRFSFISCNLHPGQAQGSSASARAREISATVMLGSCPRERTVRNPPCLGAGSSQARNRAPTPQQLGPQCLPVAQVLGTRAGHGAPQMRRTVWQMRSCGCGGLERSGGRIRGWDTDFIQWAMQEQLWGPVKLLGQEPSRYSRVTTCEDVLAGHHDRCLSSPTSGSSLDVQDPRCCECHGGFSGGGHLERGHSTSTVPRLLTLVSVLCPQ